MDRSVLPSPRRVKAPEKASGDGPGHVTFETGAAGSTDGEGLRRSRLAAPSPVRQRLRHFFKPATGWFRRLERKTSHILSRDVYPWIPGIALPYSRQIERRLTLSEADIDLPGLPAAFDGVKVLLITDIHAGPFLRPEVLERVFQRLLATRPDLIILGGDLLTSHVRELGTFAHCYRLLRAPLGTFATLGNHDHYTKEPKRVLAMIEETGARTLHNTAAVIGRDGERLVLAGVDDLLIGEPDLDAALAAANDLRSSESDPVILVSHNPDLFFKAAERGVALVLSGHTHGGQIRIPGVGVLVRQSQSYLDEGRYANGGSELVVSRGLGVTGVPLRWHCPPEAILLRLRRA